MITYKYNNKDVVIISEEIAEKYKDKIIETNWCGYGLIDVADLEKGDEEYTRRAIDDYTLDEEYLDSGSKLILEQIDSNWWLDCDHPEPIQELDEFVTAEGLECYVEYALENVTLRNIRGSYYTEPHCYCDDCYYCEKHQDFTEYCPCIKRAEEEGLERFKEEMKEKLLRIKK